MLFLFIYIHRGQNCNNFVKCMDTINKFFLFYFIYEGWKMKNIFMVKKYFKGEDRSTLRWSTKVIQKPFPSTTTRLLISTLVLVPSPIFHSTLHCESGKHVGLSRHWILQCSNCLHRTSTGSPIGNLPNTENK